MTKTTIQTCILNLLATTDTREALAVPLADLCHLLRLPPEAATCDLIWDCAQDLVHSNQLQRAFLDQLRGVLYLALSPIHQERRSCHRNAN